MTIHTYPATEHGQYITDGLKCPCGPVVGPTGEERVHSPLGGAA